MEEKRYSARTLDEAITNASEDLLLTSDKLEYEIIQEGSKGFFGFGAKPFIIVAREKKEKPVHPVKEKKEDSKSQPKAASKEQNKEQGREQKDNRSQKGNSEKKEKSGKPNDNNKHNENKSNGKNGQNNGQPKKQNQPKNAGNAEPKKDVKAESHKEAAAEKQPEKKPEKQVVLSEDPVKRAEEFLTGLFGSMEMKITYKGEYIKETNELAVDLSGEDMGVLIGKRGQTLDALQYLISQVVNKHQSSYIRVKLDTENYRERRKETMETLAQNIAQKVKRTRKPVALEPMNPYERRIIHSVLQADKEVITRSEGEEPYRHVVVCPARRKK